MPADRIPTAPFGNGGPEVTRVGLGGEGVLRTQGRNDQAREVIQATLDRGIGYFDSARAYADSERYYGTVWPKQPETRSRIFQASKSASRDRETALWDLDQTLSRMGIDRLDLWQIHDVRTGADLEAVAAPGGALEAFLEARETGRVGRIGVTGHHDPAVLSHAVREWPVDAVMMPGRGGARRLSGRHPAPGPGQGPGRYRDEDPGRVALREARNRAHRRASGALRPLPGDQRCHRGLLHLRPGRGVGPRGKDPGPHAPGRAGSAQRGLPAPRRTARLLPQTLRGFREADGDPGSVKNPFPS